jgi:hypothetical protein
MVREPDNAIARPLISISGRAPSAVLFVAEPLPHGAAAGHSDVGQSNAEVAAEQGCCGGDALKLKAHGDANREQR